MSNCCPHQIFLPKIFLDFLEMCLSGQ
jgi:hypothetical protein